MSKVNSTSLSIVSLDSLAGCKEGNFTFCKNTISEECKYQTNENHLYLPEKESDLEADTEK